MSKCRRCGEQLVIVPKTDEQMSCAHCPECKRKDDLLSQSLKAQFEKGVAEVTLVPTKQFNALVETVKDLSSCGNVKGRLTCPQCKLNLEQALKAFKTEVEDG